MLSRINAPRFRSSARSVAARTTSGHRAAARADPLPVASTSTRGKLGEADDGATTVGVADLRETTPADRRCSSSRMNDSS